MHVITSTNFLIVLLKYPSTWLLGKSSDFSRSSTDLCCKPMPSNTAYNPSTECHNPVWAKAYQEAKQWSDDCSLQGMDKGRDDLQSLKCFSSLNRFRQRPCFITLMTCIAWMCYVFATARELQQIRVFSHCNYTTFTYRLDSAQVDFDLA